MRLRPRYIVFVALIITSIVIGAVISQVETAQAQYNQASRAVAGLDPTCSSLEETLAVPDWSLRSAANLTASYSPSTVIADFRLDEGVHNPSHLHVDSNWIVYATDGGVSLTDQKTFATSPGQSLILSFDLPINTTIAVQILAWIAHAGQMGISPAMYFKQARDDFALGFHITSHSWGWPGWGGLNLNSTGYLLPHC